MWHSTIETLCLACALRLCACGFLEQPIHHFGSQSEHLCQACVDILACVKCTWCAPPGGKTAAPVIPIGCMFHYYNHCNCVCSNLLCSIILLGMPSCWLCYQSACVVLYNFSRCSGAGAARAAAEGEAVGGAACCPCCCCC